MTPTPTPTKVAVATWVRHVCLTCETAWHAPPGPSSPCWHCGQPAPASTTGLAQLTRGSSCPATVSFGGEAPVWPVEPRNGSQGPVVAPETENAT